MKKIIALILALVMVLSLCACQSTGENGADDSTAGGSEQSPADNAGVTENGSKEPEEKPLVAFLINCTTSQYSGSYYQAFNDTVAEYPDIEWKVYDGQENATLQAQQMDEAIAEGADLIMLWPQDSKALVASAEKATEAGIPVLVCNNNLDPSGEEFYTAFLGPEYYSQGVLAADAMHEMLPDGGTYVHLGCDPSYEAARLRLLGFQEQNDKMGYNLEMLGEPASCDWSLEKGKSSMSAFLSKFSGQIDAVYAVDDTIGNGGLQAIQEDKSGQNGDIKIVSIGGIEVILDAIKDGQNYYATIYQSPFIEAPAAMALAADILAGNMPAEKINPLETPIITPNNVDEYEPAY